MTAVDALALAHVTNVRVSLIGDRIRYQSRGALSADVIEALRAAKPEIVALLGRLSIDATGAIVEAGSGGDSLLARLAKLDFRVRRYGDQAALDDETGQGRVPPMPLLYEFADHQREYGAVLCALGAPRIWNEETSDDKPHAAPGLEAHGSAENGSSKPFLPDARPKDRP
jgi:hypothetical protein